MSIRVINPVSHPNWDGLVLDNEGHSFFHTSAWAKTLSTSYGYQPTYWIVPEKGHFSLLMPLMEVSSYLTGKRGVSLPFTDQCHVIALEEDLFTRAVDQAARFGRERGWRYIEWRDAGHIDDGLPASERHYVHDIDLAKTADGLFSSLSENNRRNIKKARRENVSIKIDTSLGSLEKFYRLNLMTRKRHGLPSQPLSFFLNVFEHILAQGFGIIATASDKGRAIASSVYFHFGKKAIYKYGASDPAYLHLRPNNLVMWEAMTWYSQRGFKTLNLGRTELNNPGLLQFKRTWGAEERLVKYHRYDVRKGAYAGPRTRKTARFESLLSRLPSTVLHLVGRFFYKHAG